MDDDKTSQQQRLEDEPPPGMLPNGELDILDKASRVSPQSFLDSRGGRKVNLHGWPLRKR